MPHKGEKNVPEVSEGISGRCHAPLKITERQEICLLDFMNALAGAGDGTDKNETTHLPSEDADIKEKGEGKSTDSRIQRLYSLCEKHNKFINQIVTSLDALGFGYHAKIALEVMGEEIRKLPDSFDDNTLETSKCITSLEVIDKATLEVEDSFKELKIFNISFYSKLKDFKQQLKDNVSVLYREYDLENFARVPLAGYVDIVILDPLLFKFRTYVTELETTADKEILGTIEKAQETLIQRYLNLTTVATFLSSVSATTLAITASSDPVVSTLELIMDTLWLISLVFSTASAIYSLLVISWLQSSTLQLRMRKKWGSWAHWMLRSGPMAALIVALISFSIGLCVLAFQAASQEKHLALAYLPVSFAGMHIAFIAVISAFFARTLWLKQAVDGIYSQIESFSNHIKRHCHNIMRVEISISSLFSYVLHRRRSATQRDSEDQSPINRGSSEATEASSDHDIHSIAIPAGLVALPENQAPKSPQKDIDTQLKIDKKIWTCDNCMIFPIDTVKWSCRECLDYNICNDCHDLKIEHKHGLPDIERRLMTNTLRGIMCIKCNKDIITGVRWICGTCPTDLCDECHCHEYEEPIHDKHHIMAKVEKPSLLHRLASCDICKIYNIVGVRWICRVCPSFDLCENCHNQPSGHDTEHTMIKVDHPSLAHPVSCSKCKMTSIIGIRWKCCTCKDFDLCDECYKRPDSHDHQMKEIKHPALYHQDIRCKNCDDFVVGTRWRCHSCSDYDICDKCHLQPDHHVHDMIEVRYCKDEFVSYTPFKRLLSFSPSGKWLAAGVGNSVTIKDSGKSFISKTEQQDPKGGLIEQVEWNSRDDLLIRTSKGVFVWLQREDGSQNWMLPSIGHDKPPNSLRWLSVKRFVCTFDKEFVIYDVTKVVPQKYEVSLEANFLITDTCFFGDCTDYALCLISTNEETTEQKSKFLVIDMATRSMKRTTVHSGQVYMTISEKQRIVLLHGSKSGVQYLELDKAMDTHLETLFRYTKGGQGLAFPEKMVTFYGSDEKRLVGVSDGDVKILYRESTKDKFDSLHQFKTKCIEAIPRYAVSFAIKPGTIPYMFAFLNIDGSLNIWSVQSNEELFGLYKGKSFEVINHIGGQSKRELNSMGRLLLIPHDARWYDVEVEWYDLIMGNAKMGPEQKQVL